MSLLEIVIAMAIVSLTLLALLSLIVSSNRVQDDAQERMVAYNAARRMVEEMRAVPFTEIYARYNSFTADNLSGINPGNVFTVEDLPRGPGGSPQGRILFPEGTAGPGLTENPANPSFAAELGMPKDLNRDGDTTDTALTVYDILPLKVEVEWQIPGGKLNRVQVVTFISER